MNITPEQINQLNNVWFIYGNNGLKHTHGNHKFIQHVLQGSDYRKLYKPTKKCMKVVDNILCRK